MPLPPLKSLPVFDAVARHLHFSKAAAELHLSPGAVSQHIKNLEQFLNCQLLERDNKRVALTDLGLLYWQKIHEALQLIDDAGETIKPSDPGIVNIRLMATLAMQWLIPSLTNFQQQFPDIELRISTTKQGMDFRQDNVNLAIVCGQSIDTDAITVNLLWRDHLVLIVPIQAKSLTIEEVLMQYSAIEVNAPLRQKDWPKWCEAHGAERPAQVITVANSVQGIQAVRMNAGAFVTHFPFVTHPLAQAGVHRLGQLVATDDSFYLVHARRRLGQNSQKVKNWLMNHRHD